MRDRSFSQEERMQREKEARSRQRKQEQAYREAQRGVYSRIYEEQNAMPFGRTPETGCTTGTTPAGRNPTRKRTGRRKPASRSRRTCGTIPGPSLPPPGGGQRPRRRRSPKRPTGQRTQRNPSRTTGTGRRKRMPGSPLSPARVQVKRSSPGSGAPCPPAEDERGTAWTQGAASPPESAGGGRFSSLYSSFCWPWWPQG